MSDNTQMIFDSIGQTIAGSPLSLQTYINGTNTTLLTGQLTVTAQHTSTQLPGQPSQDVYFLHQIFALSPQYPMINDNTSMRGPYVRQYKVSTSTLPGLQSGSTVLSSSPWSESNESTVSVGTSPSIGISPEGPSASVTWDQSTSLNVQDVTLLNLQTPTAVQWTYQLPLVTIAPGFIGTKAVVHLPL